MRDYADGTRIKWNAYGKIIQVRRMLPTGPQFSNAPDHREEIFFRYNAAGNRVAKYVLTYKELVGGPEPQMDPRGRATYYVRDANEQVLAVYERELQPPHPDDPCWPDYVPLLPGGLPDPNLDPDDDGILDNGCDNCVGTGLWWYTNPWQDDYDGDGQGDPCDDNTFIAMPPPAPGTVPRKRAFEYWEDVSSLPITLAELQIYGNAAQGRVGMYNANDPRDTSAATATTFTRVLRKRNYELKDHLGNVRVVVTDMKLDGGGGYGVAPYLPDVVAYNNYYPFGMLQPGRHWQPTDYRYGFNGKEMDNEVKENPAAAVAGVGNSYDYGARMYDARLGRWFSSDPLEFMYIGLSTYSAMGNAPAVITDPDGQKLKIGGDIAQATIDIYSLVPLYTRN